jgi:dipeptidyl aminopeptidase/acylaminoacyl peptidase
MRVLRSTALLVALTLTSSLTAADKRPMTLDDFFAVKRVAAPQISPDGKHVVYQVTEVDLAKNKTHTALWVTATDGKGTPKRLLADDTPGREPRWSPDGKRILFESKGGLYVTDVAGAKPVPVASISTGASHGIWAPDDKSIAFVSSVYPEFSKKPFAESDRLNKEKDEEIAKNPVKAKTFTKLFYRHWVEYVGDKRQHIFVCNADGSECRDVTPGDRDANPTSSTFDSGDNFCFTPDGKHIVFTAPPAENEAWSTNYDLCRVSITNTSTKWETLTADNKAADSGPKFSPDGKKLAWRAQKKAGYEADKWDIVVAGCKPDGTLSTKPKVASEGFGPLKSVNEFVWVERGGWMYSVDASGSQALVYENGDDSFAMARKPGGLSSLTGTGKKIACLSSGFSEAPSIFIMTLDETRTTADLNHENKALFAQLDLAVAERVEVPVEGKDKVLLFEPGGKTREMERDVKMQMWVIKPPGFDPKKKWPVVYLVHGGPQSAWRDAWSYRWNPHLWAAQGYVVVMPNPRGSVGFGQKFVDEITGDWGGKCYRDLVAGLDYVEKLPYVDRDRIAAAGGSFGGYMMNWFAVNDIAPRFKCLVTHCSVWNFESMWGTTDELWFDEWEHGGLPWEKPGRYAEFSPHKKAANLGKYKTPMLIIHNDLDFRCPIGQGHELFSALQRQGVPSRFVNFPDEGHWVLKPRNSEHWHKEIFPWLKKYAPPGGK